MYHECDVLVIGGGAAAVRAALEAASTGVKVILVDKGRIERSGSSPLALHGMATVLPSEDSEETLISDLKRTGSGINDLDLVRIAAEESRKEPERLEKMGVCFVRVPDGHYLYKDTGKSVRLVLDDVANGLNFVAVLGKEAWKRGVRLIEGVMITQLLVDDGLVVGAMGVDLEKISHTFSAEAVVLAAGGANRLYPNPVPRISHPIYRTTGDGFALALNAGLPLVDMEFANFRDTPPASTFDGTYINAKGEQFMARYDPVWREKAPRGKVVEAIYREMQAGRGPIYIEFDEESERATRVLPEEYGAYVRASKGGNPPSVTITFQRLLGGAWIKPDTSCDIRGLFIAGESAGGVHGADRLQGGAFLETQVFGRMAGIGAANFVSSRKRKEFPEILVKKYRDKLLKITERRDGPKASDILQKLHRLTWDQAGIVRNADGLKKGLAAIEDLREDLNIAVGQNTFETLEVQNLALTAEIVMRAALAREETRGTHIRSDFPQTKEKLTQKHISIKYKNTSQMEVTTVPSRKKR